MKKYEKEIMQAQLDNEKAVLKQLESNYSDALEEINSKIANLMGRADADMQHVIYQVEYQKALKKQIEGILLQLQTNEFDTVSAYLTKSYEEGFLGTMYAMQSQGVPLVFPINQEEVVAAIQHETALTKSLYEAFDMKDLQKKIAGEISRGFSTGALYKDVARNVQAVTGIEKNKAMRIARTEGHRITETAAHNAQLKAKDRGADVVKIWDATLDGKTRESHMRVDGDIKELEEKFSNGLMFPGDPSGDAAEVINCRCRSRTDARWALDADETKMLGDTSKMGDERKKQIADKLGIPVEDLDLYSGQVVPINAKNYADFKRQYNQLWHYEGSALQQEAEARIAGYEKAKTGKKSSEKSNKTLESSENSDRIESGNNPWNFNAIQGDHAINDDIGTLGNPICNPKFSTGQWGYTQNCQRCVPAYEFRRRGYDVVATERPKTNNQIVWGTECFTDANGNAVGFTHFRTAKQVQDELNNAPDGARYSIFVQWRRNSSHVFIAEKESGVVRYVDPQSGNTDVADYFRMGQRNMFGYFRMDDKLITSDNDLVKKVVESAKNV